MLLAYLPPYEGHLPVTDGFPSQKDSNAEPWRLLFNKRFPKKVDFSVIWDS